MEKTVKEKSKYYEAVGKRKTAIARVRLYEAGKTSYTINDKTLDQYFPTVEHRNTAKMAITTLEEPKHFTVSIRVRGGGVASQAEAIRPILLPFASIVMFVFSIYVFYTNSITAMGLASPSRLPNFITLV